MQLARDKDGWSILPIGATAKRVYVSASNGNDANEGTEAKPLKTLAKATKGFDPKRQNVVYLKSGDTWAESLGWLQVSGPSEAEPTIITSYSTGNRPIVKPSKAKDVGVAAQGKANLCLVDLHLTNGGSAEYGIYLAFVNNALVEGCRIEQFNDNICAQAPDKVMSNVTVRRNVIVDNHSPAERHSQGIYAQSVTSLTLEENLFDHCGWYGKDVKAIFNHGSYIKESCLGFVARGNVYANTSASGLQARGGGTVEGNLFIDCPVALTYGLVNGDGHPAAGGVTGSIGGNVILGGADTGTEKRGIGLVMGNTKQVAVTGNVIANDKSGGAYGAINFESGKGRYQDVAVGLNGLTVTGNTVYRWPKVITVAPDLTRGGKGLISIGTVTVSGNDFGGGKVVGADKLPAIPTTATTAYPNADALVTQDWAPWLAKARDNRRGNWLTEYTAEAAINKVKAAFTNTPTPAPVPAPKPACTGCCPLHCK